MSTVNFNVTGNPGTDQPILIADNPPGGTTLGTRFEGVPGQSPNRFVATVPTTTTGAATMHYQKGQKTFRVLLPPGDGPYEGGLPPCLPPEYNGDASKVTLAYSPVLLPLHADGIHIRTSDGARYIHHHATNYLLFQRFLEGQDIGPLYYPGFDGYNVTFSMRTVPAQVGFRPLRPEQYPGVFFQQADQFLARMRDEGHRIEATLLCDCQDVDLAWQRNFVAQMEEILRAYPMHMEQLANEPPGNNVDPSQFSKPAGIFASRGSSQSGLSCPLPPWDYSTAHLGRGDGGLLDAQPWFMTFGYPGYPGTKGPVIVNETRGASDTEESQRRTMDDWYFHEAASAMRGYNGGDFHADFCIHSDPLPVGSRQDICRQAFQAGMRGQAWG